MCRRTWWQGAPALDKLPPGGLAAIEKAEIDRKQGNRATKVQASGGSVMVLHCRTDASQALWRVGSTLCGELAAKLRTGPHGVCAPLLDSACFHHPLILSVCIVHTPPPWSVGSADGRCPRGTQSSSKGPLWPQPELVAGLCGVARLFGSKPIPVLASTLDACWLIMARSTEDATLGAHGTQLANCSVP